MKYTIVSGASRGLGEAIAKKLILSNTHLFCISRNKNDNLIMLAREKGIELNYFEYDLNNLEGIEKLVEGIFNKVDKKKIESISLINNAGKISPIKPVDKYSCEDIVFNINVNLIAPMILTSCFIKYSNDYNVEKRVINISSGAAKKPYYGWGCYCASKSGLDLFARCVKVEQENKEYPVKIVSFNPGVMDTSMQDEIRNSKVEDFIQLERFIAFKEEGKLLSPDFVAEKIGRLLASDNFGEAESIDIKDIWEV